jgi:Glycogen synthase
MNIVYVSSEAAPFIKTGGLADVAGSLPKAIRKKGQKISLVLPLYSQIDDKYREKNGKSKTLLCRFYNGDIFTQVSLDTKMMN